MQQSGRRWIAVGLAVAATLVAPAAASAERVGSVVKSRAALGHPAPRVPIPYGVSVQHGACPYYALQGHVTSCALIDTWTLWLAPGANRWTYWHEMGHFFDAQALNDSDRVWLTQRLGFRTGTPWWGLLGVGLSGEHHDSPGEKFAAIYAACAIGDAQRRWRGVCGAINGFT